MVFICQLTIHMRGLSGSYVRSLQTLPETPATVLLLQDVEGYEPDVLATAASLLAAGSIDNIILEYSPGVYERANRQVVRTCVLILSMLTSSVTLRVICFKASMFVALMGGDVHGVASYHWCSRLLPCVLELLNDVTRHQPMLLHC